MFDRLHWEEWHAIIPILGFAITALAFVYFVIRTMRMKDEKIDEAARLPLEDQPKDKSNTKN